MLTLLINESNPLDGLFANSTTGGVGTVPDISVADDGQAVSVQSFTRAGGIITDSFVTGDVLHIGIGDGVNAPVCYVALSSASPATGTMPINTVGMVALFAATVANQLSLTLAVVRTRGAYTNTIFSAPIVIRRSAINISTAVPTPSILGTGVAAALQVAINTALGFVRLDGSARLPAVDGSQLTNVPNELPSQTGNSGKYLTTNGTATSWGTVSTGLTVGTTAIASGTTTRVLYDNAGVLGEYTISGTGSVAMTTSPSFTTPTIGDGTESAPSLSFTSDTDTGVYRPAANTVGIVGGGNDVVRLTGIASATDYLEIKNGIGVGSPVHVLAEGASANIGVHLQPKGSGLFTISDGTDFNKGIRFRSSSSAASAITLLDAVSTAGRVVTLPDATGTLALVSGDLGTPSALVGTNITGTASGLTAGNATLAATVTVANEATDTTCFPLFATAATGSLAAKSNAGITFNSATGMLSATGLAGAFNGTVGATTPAAGTFTTVSGTSLGVIGGLSFYGPITPSVSFPALTGFGIFGSVGEGVKFIGDGTYTGVGNKVTGAGAVSLLLFSNNTAQVELTHAGVLACGPVTATTLTASATTSLLLGTAGSAVGNIGFRNATSGTATLAPPTGALGTYTVTLPSSVGTLLLTDGSGANLTALNASNISSGTLAAARMANAGVHTGDATGTFPAITLNAAQTGITSVGTLTGGATGAGFTVALSTSTITGTLADARLSANVPLKDAANTFTAANIFSANPLTLSGNQSKAAWTTTGTGLVQAAATYTDTSSSGTVAVQAVNNLAQPTLLASSATTFTDSFHTRLAGPPVASTNVTQTRAHTLGIQDSTSASRNTLTGALVIANTIGSATTGMSFGAGNMSMTGEIAWMPAGALAQVLNNGQLYKNGTLGIDVVTLDVRSSGNSAAISFSVATQSTSGFAYLQASSTSATACALTATGADSNISINVVPKGSGVTNLNGTGAAVAGTLAVTGATTLTEVTHNSANSTGVTTASSAVFNANSLTTGTGIYASSTSLTSGKLMELAVSPTGTQAPISLNLSATWNTSGSPTLLKGRITNTASGSYTSYLLDFGTVATRYFGLTAEGRLYLGSGGLYVNESNGALQNNGGNVVFAASPTGATNNLYDLGTNATRWRTLYVATSIENSGTLAVTGATTLSAALITTPQALSGAGAVNITTAATDFTSTGAANALTLANGTVGQFKFISHAVKGTLGTGVLTPTTCIGFTTITFNNAGDSVTLRYTSAGWAVHGSFGAVIA